MTLALELRDVAKTFTMHLQHGVQLPCVAGVSFSVQARLLDLIRGLVADLKLSVVIVTHDLAVARLLSHRIIVMKDGQVIESGLTDQVLDDPREPYTQLLVSSILPP